MILSLRIQNIVASASLGGKIRLDVSGQNMCQEVYSETEQFPGLINGC